MAKRLYVGNLPYSIKDSDLLAIFAEIGPVASARIITDRTTGYSLGYGFVEMDRDEDADKALAQYNGGDLEGRLIKVTLAKSQENRSMKMDDFFGRRKNFDKWW